MNQSIRLEQFLALRAQRQKIHPDLASILMVIAGTGSQAPLSQRDSQCWASCRCEVFRRDIAGAAAVL